MRFPRYDATQRGNPRGRRNENPRSERIGDTSKFLRENRGDRGRPTNGARIAFRNSVERKNLFPSPLFSLSGKVKERRKEIRRRRRTSLTLLSSERRRDGRTRILLDLGSPPLYGRKLVGGWKRRRTSANVVDTLRSLLRSVDQLSLRELRAPSRT